MRLAEYLVHHHITFHVLLEHEVNRMKEQIKNGIDEKTKEAYHESIRIFSDMASEIKKLSTEEFITKK